MGVANTIARNTFFNSVATYCEYGVTFAVGIILARGLGTEQYGLYSYLLWFLGFGLLIVNLGVGDMVRRFVAEALGQQNKDASKGFIRLALLVRILAPLVVGTVMLALSGYCARTLTNPNDQIYFILLAFVLAPYAVTNLLMSIFTGFQKYKYSAIVVWSTRPLRLILVLVFMILGFGIWEILVLNMGTWLLSMIVGFFLLGRLIPLREFLKIPPLDRVLRNNALKYSFIMAGYQGVNYFAAGQIAILLIGLYCPVEEVGFFTLAVKIPYIVMFLIPQVLGAVLLPAIAEQFGKADMDRLKRIYLTSARYLMTLALPLAAAGVALARPITSLLYGADYMPAAVPMQIMFVPFAMWVIAGGVGTAILGINRPAFILKASIFLACVNVGLCFWLIPRYGILGAAIGNSASLFLILPIYVRFVSKEIKVKWPLGDTARIVLASTLMGLALFGLQNYLSGALLLVVAIPLGLAIYIVAILALRTVRQQDLDILKGIQGSLPISLRKIYVAMLGLVEGVVIR